MPRKKGEPPPDFAGKLPEDTPERRHRFLFLLINFLIQYSPANFDVQTIGASPESKDRR